MLTQNLGGVSFNPLTDGLYATYKVGADTVVKKLGDPLVLKNLIAKSTNGSTGTSIFDISSIYKDYSKLTTDKLIISAKKLSEISGGGFTFEIKHSYNPSSGIITVITYVDNLRTLVTQAIDVVIY